mmetsp:Transcript_67178/g.218714  ORF Transcript_67178/g.218714 Transcript_67178/m.218714 type:complete len:276 (+) Transcript_67178:81-908(+)
MRSATPAIDGCHTRSPDLYGEPIPSIQIPVIVTGLGVRIVRILFVRVVTSKESPIPVLHERPSTRHDTRAEAGVVVPAACGARRAAGHEPQLVGQPLILHGHLGQLALHLACPLHLRLQPLVVGAQLGHLSAGRERVGELPLQIVRQAELRFQLRVLALQALASIGELGAQLVVLSGEVGVLSGNDLCVHVQALELQAQRQARQAPRSTPDLRLAPDLVRFPQNVELAGLRVQQVAVLQLHSDPCVGETDNGALDPLGVCGIRLRPLDGVADRKA